MFQRREGNSTKTFLPPYPSVGPPTQLKIQTVSPWLREDGRWLPRMRWDSKCHYLQRFLCNCVLLSPSRRQNLRKPCSSLLKTLIFSLWEVLHTKIRFGHVGSPCDCPNEFSDFVTVWYLHQVLHPQELVLDSFLITWMVNYRVRWHELSTMNLSFFFSSFSHSLSIYRFFWE